MKLFVGSVGVGLVASALTPWGVERIIFIIGLCLLAHSLEAE